MPQTVDDLLREVEASTGKHVQRVENAMAGLTEDELNRRTISGDWSPYEVVDHMCLANRPYLDSMRKAIDTLEPGDGTVALRHSWFGGYILRGSGPNGNIPAPKKLHPRDAPYDATVLEKWKEQQTELAGYCTKAKGRDLIGARVPNPFLPLFRMNVADFFAILAAHTERHVRQIEERTKRS